MTGGQAMGDELLTVKEAAAYIRVHEETMRTWIRKGTIPHQRFGRVIRIRREDLLNPPLSSASKR